MTRLFAISCNDTSRMREALTPHRGLLVADEAAHGYGMASYQDGEVLLQRTPRPTAPVDFYDLLPAKADVVLGALGAPGSPPAPDNTPPSRYRSWVFGATGRLADLATVVQARAETAPEFLLHKLRGGAPAERLFMSLLGELHQGGVLDDLEPRLDETVEAIRRAILGFEAAARARELTPWNGALMLTNGRFLIAARVEAPVYWWRLRTDRPPPKPRPEAASELRQVVVIAEPRQAPSEGFELLPPRSIATVTRDFATQIVPLEPAPTSVV
jgi:predicted glutamine amidotransferase